MRFCKIYFFRGCLKIPGLGHFHRPHARGLAMKNVSLEPCISLVFGQSWVQTPSKAPIVSIALETTLIA